MKVTAAALKRRAAAVGLLLMDVDGVLTDGRLLYVPHATGGAGESKAFDSQDGLAMHWLREMGFPVGWISGRESPAVVARAETLKVAYLYQNHLAKLGPYQEILQRSGMADSQIGYIGDDLTDFPIMKRAGLAVAVANARPEIKGVAHYVTRAAGGRGAVREVIELLLKSQNKWSVIQKKYGLT